MPAFALANAGVTIVPDKFDTTLVLAIFVGFVIGKPVGIVVLSALAVKLRIANRPKDLPWRTLAAGSMLAGIGFTMALFIAGLAFSPDLLGSVKVGILLGSLVSAIAGMLVLVCLCGPSRR
ncbi:Na(+)/H(+) antiporter NhaA [compost metagenome]